MSVTDGLPPGPPGFRLLEKLGEGAFGAVYKAHQVDLDRPVAIKFVLNVDTADHARFVREAEVLTALRHPAIVALYTADVATGNPYLVFEWIDGATLRTRIDAGPVGGAQALDLARELFEGLDHAHAAGVIHRDIKPENLLLPRSGGLKIADFGLARANEVRERLTLSGTVMGTPQYMSPQQADGRRVDHRTDLYSAGIVLYELLAGRPPFLGDRLLDVLQAQVHTVPPPLDRLVDGVPERLSALMARLLAKDPDERPARAGEVAETLAGITGSTIGIARTPRGATVQGMATGRTEASARRPAGADAAQTRVSSPNRGSDHASADGSDPTPTETVAAGRGVAGAPGRIAPMPAGATGTPGKTVETARSGDPERKHAGGRMPAEASRGARTAIGTAGRAAPASGPGIGGAGAARTVTGPVRPMTGPVRGITAVPPADPGRRPVAAGAIVAGFAGLAVMAFAVVALRTHWSRPTPREPRAGEGAAPAATATVVLARSLRLTPLPPRRMRVDFAPSVGRSARLVVRGEDRVERAVSLAPSSTTTVVGGLSPGGSYAVELRDGEAAPVTSTLAMPRPLPAEIELVPLSGGFAASIAGQGRFTLRMKVERVLPKDHVVPVEERALEVDRRAYVLVEHLKTAATYKATFSTTDTHWYVGATADGVQFVDLPDPQATHSSDALTRSVEGLPLFGALGEGRLMDRKDLTITKETYVHHLSEPGALEDETSALQYVQGLGAFLDPSTLPQIQEYLARVSSAEVRAHLIGALADIAAPGGFDVALKEGRKLGEDELAGRYLCGALVNCDRDRAVALFRDVARHPESWPPAFRLAAAGAPMRLHDDDLVSAVGEMARRQPTTLMVAVAAGSLAQHGGDAARDQLCKMLDQARSRSPSDSALETLLLSLARIGRGEDATGVGPYLERTYPPSVRRLAIWALAAAGGDRAQRWLTGALSDPNPAAQRLAACGLGKLRVVQAADALAARLDDHETSKGRFPRALGMIGTGLARERLVAMLRAPADSGAAHLDRAEALLALGRMREAGARDTLVEALGSPIPFERACAALGLGFLGDRASEEALRGALAREAISIVREDMAAAIDWLAQGTPRGDPIVVDADTPWIRTGITLAPGEHAQLYAVGALAASSRALAGDGLFGPAGAPREGEHPRPLAILPLLSWMGPRAIFEPQPAAAGQWHELDASTNGFAGDMLLETKAWPGHEGAGFMLVWVRHED